MRSEGVLGGLLCGFITILLVVIVRRRSRGGENGRFPPGPRGWPVLGHLHLFAHRRYQALAQLSKEYGPVVGLRLGQQRAVVVCSPESAKEVLLTHDKVFAYRPPLQFTSIMRFGPQNGVLYSNHGPWRKYRKICLLHLFTAKRLHELQFVRQQELDALLLSLLHHSCTDSSAAVDLGKCVGQMSSRLIMRLVHSQATEQVGDENLQQLMKEVGQQLTPIMGDLIPSLSILDFFSKQRMRRLHARLDKVYTRMLMERTESMSLHDDLLHSLLSQREALTVVEIKGILHDIIGAGIHTTALTLEWGMSELLKNPRCLHRLQSEIDMQVGETKEVSEADLPYLSYLKCVVKEVFRLHPVVPLLVPRISMEECKLQEYIIPAKTFMFVNVSAIGRDERVWPNANEFMPERFEGKDVDLKGQHFELLPFGSGRRTCVGLPFALPVIEVTLANLVSCFDWELPYGVTHTSINMDERRGFTGKKTIPLMAIPKPRVSFSKLGKV